MQSEPASLTQPSFGRPPRKFAQPTAWSKSPRDLPEERRHNDQDLSELMGGGLRAAETLSDGRLSFSASVPHGGRGSSRGNVMMTRVETGRGVFVHASDIQLIDDATVGSVLAWTPDIVPGAGPPLYLSQVTARQRARAWDNAIRLAEAVEVVILDHHLLRSREGERRLDRMSMKVGKDVSCATDMMKVPRRLLEADRRKLYGEIYVPPNWHEDYARCRPAALDLLATMHRSIGSAEHAARQR